MYAVIITGGKQYRVSEGDVIQVEKLPGETGEPIDFGKVLLIENEGDFRIGVPYLKGGKVSGKVLSHGRADKIEVLKFRRRKSSMRRQGHRQAYTEVQITGISEGRDDGA